MSTSRKKQVDPLSKRIHQNPKYKNVQGKVDTGASLTKYLQRIDDIKTNYKLRKDEIFKRMKITTFVQLMVQVYLANEDDFTLPDSPEPPNDDDDRIEVGGSPVPSLALTDGDFGEDRSSIIAQSSRSTLHSVSQGMGELDLNGPPEHGEKASIDIPYLLLDVREDDEYRAGHIITAQHYPKAMLSRSVNYETKEMLAFKNHAGRFIVIYDEDERIGPAAANTLVQRGYDNLFMLSGGLKLAKKLIPADGLVTSNGVCEAGSLNSDSANEIEMHLDNALQAPSSASSRMSQTSTATSRMSTSRSSARSSASTVTNKPFR